MTEFIWKVVARIASQPRVANWLISRAKRTPYFHIMSPDGTEVYMYRWWLFNPYDYDTRELKYPRIPFSVRIHHIMEPDGDRHLHDHPWNARTIILKNGYTEVRSEPYSVGGLLFSGISYERKVGDTTGLRFGEFHRIAEVKNGGAVTLFITGKYRGVWGFLVDGVKRPFRQYLAEREQGGGA